MFYPGCHFPKGTDFLAVTDGDVRAGRERSDGRPGEAPVYRTPAEVFIETRPPGPPALRAEEKGIFRARPPGLRSGHPLPSHRRTRAAPLRAL